MHRKALVLLLILFGSVSGLFAQRLSGRFLTSMYLWERHDTIGTARTHAFSYQTIQFDFHQKNVSLHAHLQGFGNLRARGFTEEPEPKLRLYNLYVKMTNNAKTMELNVGRQTVFAGVGSGTLDGLHGRLEVMKGKGIFIGYAGAMPPPFLKAALISNVSENYVLGGQVIALPFSGARFGLSYMNRLTKQPSYEALRRDRDENVFRTVIDPEPYTEEFVGVDASYRPRSKASFYGRYEYDLKFEQISRGQVFSRVFLMDKLALTGEYIYRSPRIPFHSFFALFPRNSVRELEGGMEYNLNPR